MKRIKIFIKRIIPRQYHSKISFLYNYLHSLFLFGFKYQCNFYHGHFRKLLPVGLKNDIALSLIGGDIVILYALDVIHWTEKGGDLNPLVADRKIDITDINFGNDYFDFIICNHVLEHIQDDRKTMSEIFRVLRPGGKAILQVPISKYNKETFENFSIILPEEREKYFGQKDHVRIHGKDYKKRLESVGFKVELYDIKKNLSIQDIKKYGLNEEEILYIVHK